MPHSYGAGSASALPVLWQLHMSHYNEKARWALDYKGIAHVRRACVPGRHSAVAARLTDGAVRTLPVLVLDGEAIGDSTRIIAALEERFPEPALYPAAGDVRQRALDLEDFFDENLGAYTRRLFIEKTYRNAPVLLGSFMPGLSRARRIQGRIALRAARRQITKQFEISPATVEEAREKVRATGELFKAEGAASGYLAGDSFTVADLTLAALLSPLVVPDESPSRLPEAGRPLFEPLRELLDQYGLLEWTRRIYARHRGSSAAVPEPGGSRFYSRLPA